MYTFHTIKQFRAQQQNTSSFVLQAIKKSLVLKITYKTTVVINNKTGIKTVTLQKVRLSTILIFLQEHIKTPAVNQHYSYFINPNGLQHLIEVDELVTLCSPN